MPIDAHPGFGNDSDPRLPPRASATPDVDLTGAILEAALDCIITIDADGRVVEFNPAAERTFGYRRAEAIGRPLAELIIPPGLREQHREAFARHLATGEARILGRRVEVPALRADGSEFPVELAIARIAGASRPLFTAYLRDISARVRTERLRNLRLAVTQRLAQDNDVHAAAVAVLRAICEHLQWDFGAFWLLDADTGRLRCAASWSVPELAAGEFARATAAHEFPRNVGLPGRAIEADRPAWVMNVQADPNMPRAQQAGAEGLRSAFACPVRVAQHEIGALEFFTRRLREPDPELLETMATLAGQFALFVQNARGVDRLRESEARFRALMDQAPISMQMFSPDGRTERVNPAWSALWGVTLEQIGDYNVLHDPQLDEKGITPFLRRAFAGEAVAIPAIRYDPNRTLPDRSAHEDPARFVSAVAYPLKDDAGRVRQVVLVHEDITARRRAEIALRESEEQLRLLVDTIPQLAWMARPDGHILWYNRRWYEYTGTTAEQMQGWGWQCVHDPAVLPAVLEQWKASIDSGMPFEMVFPLRGADGAFRQFLTRTSPLKDADGRILAWFGTNTDVSELKDMEKALREADRRKDEFLAILAHELRNPLAPIASSLHLLQLPSLPEEKAQRALGVMARQLKHLVRLVDDLLDVSRIARGKIELHRERMDLSSAIARAVEVAEPLIASRGHQLQVIGPDQLIEVDADPVRLAQIVGNLLNNAASYTPPEGRIRVVSETDGMNALVHVEDNGIGISDEFMPRLFDPFAQAGRVGDRSQGGLGIGLSLVRSLARLHGGDAWAHSRGPGMGSRFTVSLPRAAARG